LRWLAGPGDSMLEVVHPASHGPPMHPGDHVIIEVDDGELLRAAALAYVPPLVGLLAGPVAAATLVPRSEPTAPAAALLGLAAGWGAARLWLRRSPPRYRLSQAEAA